MTIVVNPSTLMILGHNQGLNGQINMNIQFFQRDKDNFKFETSLDQDDLIPENISSRILVNSPDTCLTVSPIGWFDRVDHLFIKKE